jgi:hypothetical protein
MNKNKEWVPIVGFEDYVIRNDGSFKRSSKVKIIKPEVARSGELIARLVNSDKKRKQVKISFLVATAFIDNPNNFEHVRYIDGDIKNVHYTNLEWYDINEIESLPGEVWKDVVGLEEYYQVSNLGRMFSKPQKVLNEDGSLNRMKLPTLMKFILNHDGYEVMKVNIKNKNIHKTFKVHRLVAQAFLPNPDSLPQVNHIDGNKANNKLDNLEWISNKDNHRHAEVNGLFPDKFKSKKVGMYDVNTGELIRTFDSVHEVGAILLESSDFKGKTNKPKTVREQVRTAANKNGASYGYQWKYIK